MTTRVTRMLGTAVLIAGLTAAGTAPADAGGGGGRARTGPQANDDSVAWAHSRANGNVLTNDRSASAVVRHTAPAHGSVSIAADGSFSYVPAHGYHGTDSFTYTVSDAVRLNSTHLQPLGAVGGTTITGGSYGSSLAPAPGRPGYYYGLTDRGPNVDGPNGEKIEPLPDFQPAIGLFRFTGVAARSGDAVLVRRIGLAAADGSPFNGQVNPQADTGETIVDDTGTTLPTSANGYDSEGLVALRDGTFWVSDEYGPFITHFDARGRELGRLSPFAGSLPRELALRVPNKGMEGLTVTPDGRTLVGVMQSALQTKDLTAKAKNVPVIRIVTVDVRTHASHEYVYLLDDPDTTSSAISEITALSATRFVVDERDGNFAPGAFKKLYTIDLRGASDVGPSSPDYTAAAGRLVDGKSLEQFVGKATTAQATKALVDAGITPVAKSLALDLGGLLTQLDPSGGFFGHDKIEGVATTDHGRTLVISNDSDFGIDGITTQTPPYGLHVKTLPDGTQDDGAFLTVDATKLPALTSTATVTIRVP